MRYQSARLSVCGWEHECLMFCSRLNNYMEEVVTDEREMLDDGKVNIVVFFTVRDYVMEHLVESGEIFDLAKKFNVDLKIQWIRGNMDKEKTCVGGVRGG